MKTNSFSEKRLSLTQLDQHLKSLASQERELLCQVIQTIQEVHKRKAYLELGFANLFSYLVEGIGYSKGSAYRRIQAARLVTEIPEMLGEIKSGDLKLTQVSLVQQAVREKTKTSAVQVTTNDKKEILSRITQKNFEHSQQQVAEFFDLPIQDQSKLKVQADDSVRIEVTLPRELYEKMKHAQSLVSHAVPTADWVSFLQYVSDRIIKQKTSVWPEKSVKTPIEIKRDRNTSSSNCLKSTDSKLPDVGRTQASSQSNQPPKFPTVENSAAESIKAMSFSARQRKLLLRSAPGCEFRDLNTGKQCHSRWFLQIDHKQSRWAGGSNALENAQVLCAHHNRFKYSKEAGISASVSRSR